MQRFDVYWVMNVLVPEMSLLELQMLRESVEVHLTSREYQAYQESLERRRGGGHGGYRWGPTTSAGRR